MSRPVTTYVPLIILLAETRMIPNDNTNEYLIPQYDIPYQNDQILDTPTRPSHGMISSVRIPVRVLEKHKWSDTHFEAILLRVEHTVLPLLVQVIGVIFRHSASFQFYHYLYIIFSSRICTTITCIFKEQRFPSRPSIYK